MSLALGRPEADRDRDRDAVDTATDMLRSMVEDGNLPAAGFYQHLLELRRCFDLGGPEGGGPGPGSGKPLLAGRLVPLGDADTVNNNSSSSNIHGADGVPGGGVGVSAGVGVGVSVAADEGTDFSALSMTVLDDPSIQSFLTQSDIQIQWGLPGALEEASGDVMGGMARWIFE
ncbi:hypothetical protein VTN02DRAFT_947 [Thermoascus thermophilus]